jgi:hypothetical protein
MNANTVTTRPEPPAWGLRPSNVGRSARAEQSNALVDLKNRLLLEAQNRAPDEPLSRLVRLAAVEAGAHA